MVGCMLTRVPIDIVEMVIVSSDNYKLFIQLQKLLLKLQELKRVARIKDKLTKVTNNHRIIEYTLFYECHREYNKPAQIYYDFTMYTSTVYNYHQNGVYKRDDGYSRINLYYRDDGRDNFNNKNSQELFIHKSYYYNRIVNRGFNYF